MQVRMSQERTTPLDGLWLSHLCQGQPRTFPLKCGSRVFSTLLVPPLLECRIFILSLKEVSESWVASVRICSFLFHISHHTYCVKHQPYTPLALSFIPWPKRGGSQKGIPMNVSGR